MHLFLIISVPLAYIYLLILRDQAGQPSTMTAIPALKGALAYLLVLIPLLFIDRFVERPFTGAAVYFYGTVYDYLVPGGTGFLLYLWFTRDVGGMSPEERFLSLCSFMAGLFTFAGIMDLFLRADYFGPYELFHLPALRIGMILLLPTFYYHFSEETFLTRYLYLLAMVAVPFALGTVALLTAMYLAGAATAVTLVLFLGAWAVSLFWAGNVKALRLR